MEDLDLNLSIEEQKNLTEMLDNNDSETKELAINIILNSNVPEELYVKEYEIDGTLFSYNKDIIQRVRNEIWHSGRGGGSIFKDDYDWFEENKEKLAQLGHE